MSNVSHQSRHLRAYRSWIMMRQRCLNPRSSRFQSNGARGIKVCERWERFEHFLADMGERPPGKKLERVDKALDYGPSNCRWAAQREFSRTSSVTPADVKRRLAMRPIGAVSR